MIKYFIKYYIYNGSSKFFRSSFILPLITVIIGCFVMMMSFAIMEGFSNEISDTIYLGNGQNPATKMMVPNDSLNIILKKKGLVISAPKPFAHLKLLYGIDGIVLYDYL